MNASGGNFGLITSGAAAEQAQDCIHVEAALDGSGEDEADAEGVGSGDAACTKVVKW